MAEEASIISLIPTLTADCDVDADVSEKAVSQLCNSFPGKTLPTELMIVALAWLRHRHLELLPDALERKWEEWRNNPSAGMVDRPFEKDADIRKLITDAIAALEMARLHMTIPASSVMGAAVWAMEGIKNRHLADAAERLGRDLTKDETSIITTLSRPDYQLRIMWEETAKARNLFPAPIGRPQAIWHQATIRNAVAIFMIVRIESGASLQQSYPVEKNGGERWCGLLAMSASEQDFSVSVLKKHLISARKQIKSTLMKWRNWIDLYHLGSPDYNSATCLVLLSEIAFLREFPRAVSMYPLLEEFCKEQRRQWLASDNNENTKVV